MGTTRKLRLSIGNSFRLAAAIGALSLSPRVFAADNWLNPAGGSWTDGTNWSQGAPPTDFANFNLNAATAYTVTSGQPVLANVQNDKVIIDMNGASVISTIFVPTVASNALGQVSSLTIKNGIIESSNGWNVGGTDGASSLSIDAVTAWVSKSSFTVGGSGNSSTTFNQTNGEVRGHLGVEIGTGTGTVIANISGGKTWSEAAFIFGEKGTTTATLSSGADVYTQYGNIQVGLGTGNATVNINSSTLAANGYATIGAASIASPANPMTSPATGGGTGKVVVSNGTFSSSGGIVVGNAGGDGTLIGEGASALISVLSRLFVGDHGTGAVSLTSGAKMTNAISNIGGNGGSGTATISDTGTTWIMQESLDIGLVEGVAGTGLVTVKNNATLSDTGPGGGPLRIAAGGTLQAFSGGRVHSTTLSLVSGSHLDIGLDGEAVASNGQVNVDGLTTFAGTLDVDLENGFQPVVGDQFQLFTFGSETGTFSTVNLPYPYTWDTSKLYTQGIVSVTAVPEPTMIGLLGLGSLALRRRARSLCK